MTTSYHEEQLLLDADALENPKIGDYWHEMFCPYFIIVDIKDKKFTILNCSDGGMNRKETNAKVDNRDGTWSFDYSKSMVVDHEWIRETVTYSSIKGFVADVSRTEKSMRVVEEWRDYVQKSMLEEIDKLKAKWEEFTGWSLLKGDINNE